MFGSKGSKNPGALFVELIMIVVGINVALWFEGLAEEFSEREAEQQYLQGLYEDLQTDIESLDEMIRLNEAKAATLKEMIPELGSLQQQTPERQTEVIFRPSSYHFFQPEDFTYKSMRESGDFRLLSDPDIKRSLLQLARTYRLIAELQANYIQGMDDEYIPLMMANFNLMEQRVTNPALLENQVFRNFFPWAFQETTNRTWVLNNARKQAEELQTRIGEQIR